MLIKRSLANTSNFLTSSPCTFTSPAMPNLESIVNQCRIGPKCFTIETGIDLFPYTKGGKKLLLTPFITLRCRILINDGDGDTKTITTHDGDDDFDDDSLDDQYLGDDGGGGDNDRWLW